MSRGDTGRWSHWSSFREQVAEKVIANARERLVRELVRALESGLTLRDVAELGEIARKLVDEQHEKG